MEGRDLVQGHEDLRRQAESARRDAAAAEERFAFLARASEVLGAPLHYETTFKRLAEVVVPRLADWYSVDLMDDPDTIQNVAVAHVDPRKVELARELQARYPPDPHAPNGIPQVVRTGRPEIYREIPDAMLEAAATSAEHLELLRDLGLRSALVVPLSARGRTFGALTMVTAESGRIYTESDLTLAKEIGERAGLAIDNARLFEAQARASARLAMLARVGDLLAASL